MQTVDLSGIDLSFNKTHFFQVLDKGYMVQFDSPSNLLEDKDGLFFQMTGSRCRLPGDVTGSFARMMRAVRLINMEHRHDVIEDKYPVAADSGHRADPVIIINNFDGNGGDDDNDDDNDDGSVENNHDDCANDILDNGSADILCDGDYMTAL